jgi:D-alanine--D-alanine ligase
MKNELTIALLCGGPSPERGISLNSARSVADHLEGDGIKIVPIYFDIERRPYLLSRGQLYSNTPSDFDFKLAQEGEPLSWSALKRVLGEADLAFPVVHGEFGEDGELQRTLEGWGIPFVGTGAESCEVMFDKFVARTIMDANGFFTLPALLGERDRIPTRAEVAKFLRDTKSNKVVVKPAQGGSSLGVSIVTGAAPAHAALKSLLKDDRYERAIIEPHCKGREFTVVVLQSRFGIPVALPPLEVATEYHGQQFFDFRKKYLPHHQTQYHCPPRFSPALTERIQIEAEQLFALFGMNDFVRIDGWVLDDGELLFSDINPMSGLEQNSFLFIQASRVGFTHREALMQIVDSACRRHGIPWVPVVARTATQQRLPVRVLFGGGSAERQVSVMSGTNSWLKLQRSTKYQPVPYLLDRGGRVWELPYTFTLNHTVEEIEGLCRSAPKVLKLLEPIRERVLRKLGVDPEALSARLFSPRAQSLKQFLQSTELLLNALHGGLGEDGRLQKLCQQLKVPFNGAGPAASRLCMDKFQTGEAIIKLQSPAVRTAPKVQLPLAAYRRVSDGKGGSLWQGLSAALGPPPYIVKPNGDGCSAGVVTIETLAELRVYCRALLKGDHEVQPGTFRSQPQPIDMPVERPRSILVERRIETDLVRIVGSELLWKKRSGYVEVTVGVLGSRGKMRALPPSLTVARDGVLSVEEKFQGGTGVNITPPPGPWVSPIATARAMRNVESVARALGLEGYARIDAFMDCQKGDLIVIEANTLPALTPSTVLFHQAFANSPPRAPRELLEELLQLGLDRTAR